jgi:hypothetical protein
MLMKGIKGLKKDIRSVDSKSERKGSGKQNCPPLPSDRIPI